MTSIIVHSSMNKLTNQESRKLHQLAQIVGNFIRYWGFRQIHGEIWTVLFLNKMPLAAVEIERALKVSKALVSPALQELMHEGLIRAAPSENLKTKRYEAVENVTAVIRNVLRRREQLMIAEAAVKHLELQDATENEGDINPRRLEILGSMIQSANFGLLALVNEDDFWTA